MDAQGLADQCGEGLLGNVLGQCLLAWLLLVLNRPSRR
jgi:hypothetical protein